MSVSIEQARIAKLKVKDLVSTRQNLQRVLSGIGIGRIGQDYAVRVNLSEPVPDADMPSSLDGVPVEFVTVGNIRKRTTI
jgi:hypothetical protein